MEAAKFIIDSSVLVAFYYQGDAYHVDALRVMAALNDKILVIHPYVIQETATVLTYKIGNYLSAEFLSDVLNSQNVIVPMVDVKDEAEYFKNLNKKISFTDSTLINMAKNTGASLVTFDRQILALIKR